MGELRSKLKTQSPPTEAMASEAYTNELFRKRVLAHLLNTDQNLNELAYLAGIAASELDELGAGRRDVELSVLKVLGLHYSRLPKNAERAQLHLQTTGTSPYTRKAELDAQCAARTQQYLLKCEALLLKNSLFIASTDSPAHMSNKCPVQLFPKNLQ